SEPAAPLLPSARPDDAGEDVLRIPRLADGSQRQGLRRGSEKLLRWPLISGSGRSTTLRPRLSLGRNRPEAPPRQPRSATRLQCGRSQIPRRTLFTRVNRPSAREPFLSLCVLRQ